MVRKSGRARDNIKFYHEEGFAWFENSKKKSCPDTFLLAYLFSISRRSRLVKNYTAICFSERLPNGKDEEYQRKCHLSTLFHFITFYLCYFLTFPVAILSEKQSAAELFKNSKAIWFLWSGFFKNLAIVLLYSFNHHGRLSKNLR